MALRVIRRNATGTETAETPMFDRAKNTRIALGSIAFVLILFYVIGRVAAK